MPDHLRRIRVSFFFCILMVACNTKNPVAELIPEEEATPEWIYYEGRVPLDENRSLYFEVALLPGIAGEGSYRLHETLEEEGGRFDATDLSGNYSTYADADQRLVLQFHNATRAEGFRRSYVTNNGKTLREETIRNTDLNLWRKDERTLIVLNYRKEPITLEPNYNLVKRLSPIFTVEGYFRHTVDSAVFFEVNTGEQWAVSKRGAYDQAAREYHQLVKEKFDSVYLKAIGYTIRQNNRKGIEIEALVLKRILQTTSPPAIDTEMPLVENK